MGLPTALIIAEANLSLEDKMVWQLQGNHYPPIDSAFIPAAVKAVELAQQNDWDTVIELPNQKQKTVHAIVTMLHLEPFVNNTSEEETNE